MIFLLKQGLVYFNFFKAIQENPFIYPKKSFDKIISTDAGDSCNYNFWCLQNFSNGID